MGEVISSKAGEASNQNDNSASWNNLKEVPFAEEGHQTSPEITRPKYETELNSPDDILNDINNFTIKNGTVYSRETRQVETSEDAILRAKTSRFLFDEAKALRDTDANANSNRFIDRGPEFYIDKAMARYAINDEENSYGTNKLINELVRSGKFNEAIGSGDLADTKFAMFSGEKADYGKALLRRKFRQRGMDISDFQITLDNSEFQHNGYSNVSIEITSKSFVQQSEIPHQATDAMSVLRHPAAERLNQLQHDLAEARKNNDEDAAAGYRAAIKHAVSENPLEVSPEEWDNMDNTQKEQFYRLKMQEAKILGDKEAFDFWNANLRKSTPDENGSHGH